MPNTKIETCSGWIDDASMVINAVQSALRDALQLPEWDRTLRLFEHDPTHFGCPPGKGPRYMLIEITMFAGRSLDAKRSLYKAIVKNLGALGVPADDIKITLIEAPLENWGVRGGHPASEIPLGFKINV